MTQDLAWTKEEETRLKELYLDNTVLFSEIEAEFPHRTPNALRLKTSRLGLKRQPLELLGTIYIGAIPVRRDEAEYLRAVLLNHKEQIHKTKPEGTHEERTLQRFYLMNEAEKNTHLLNRTLALLEESG